MLSLNLNKKKESSLTQGNQRDHHLDRSWRFGRIDTRPSPKNSTLASQTPIFGRPLENGQTLGPVVARLQL
jgi:hypothetical protein